MGNNVFKIAYIVFMILIVLTLAVFMVIHIRAGLDSQNAKLLLGAYILLIIWACHKIYCQLRSLSNKTRD